MKANLSPEKIQFVLDNAMLKSMKDIGKEIGFSREVVRRLYKENNVVIPENISRSFASEKQRKKTTLTAEQDKIIRDSYLIIPIKRLAVKIGKSQTAVRTRLRQLNLVVPKELALERSRGTMFKKGQIHPNKGKKMEDWMSAENLAIFRSNQFKANHIPHNALPDHSEVERKDTSGKVYVLVKVPGDRKLKLKQRVVWETFMKKKIPKKHNIVFKDGDTRNFYIDNLECISNEDLMIRNSIQKYPEELREIIRLNGKLNRTINQDQQ